MPRNEWSLIDEKSWDPAWEQVILFLAGSLADSPGELERLIEILSDEQADSVLRYRHTLAVKCLGELPERALKAFERTAIVIDRVFSFWQQARIPSVSAALPALVNTDSRNGGRMITRLLKDLKDPNKDVRCDAAEALERMGGAAARNEIVNQLVQLLGDPLLDVQSAAVEALREMGATAAARDDILDNLSRCVLDSESGLRFKAASALGHIGAVAKDNVLDRLLQLLRNPNWHVRFAAASALKTLGPAAVRDDILGELLQWMCYSDSGAREAAEAVGELGLAAARTDVVDRLLRMLHDRNFDVHLAAAVALVRMAAVPRDQVLDSLFQYLQNPAWDVRSRAAEALGKMQAAAARDDILDQLLNLLHDAQWDVRREAARALKRIGAVQAKDNIRDRLLQLVHDPDAYARLAAVQELARIGAAARGSFLDWLFQLLCDSNTQVRSAAALVIVQTGTAAARDDILKQLFRLWLNRPKWRVLSALAVVLGEILFPTERGGDYALGELWRSQRVQEACSFHSATALDYLSQEGVHLFRRFGKRLKIKRIARSEEAA